jgi:hypothetical protein
MSGKAPRLVLLATFVAMCISSCSDSKPVQTSTPPPAAKPPNDIIVHNDGGNQLDLKSTLQEGEVNVLFFYSPAVAECTQMEAPIRKLAKSRPDLIIQRIDIDRPGTTAPDYQSPVALQFAIKKLPNFRIYDSDGDLVTTDASATAIIKQWMLPKKSAP